MKFKSIITEATRKRLKIEAYKEINMTENIDDLKKTIYKHVCNITNNSSLTEDFDLGRFVISCLPEIQKDINIINSLYNRITEIEIGDINLELSNISTAGRKII